MKGFSDRREARKLASQMLKTGFIKHTVNKTTFSEQCYYAFGDEATISAGELVCKGENMLMVHLVSIATKS